METGKRILIPLDGSDLSAWALARTGRLLEQPGAEVTLLSVIEAEEDRASDLAFQVDPRHRERHDVLSLHKERLTQRSIVARAEIRFGDPAREILREISIGGYGLVAMTTHGRTGFNRLAFGSVALRVLQASPVPLLLFRPLQRPDETLSPAETSEPAHFGRILVPLDGSSYGEEILPWAEGFARMFGSKLVLFRAIPGGADEADHRRTAQEYLDRHEQGIAFRGLQAVSVIRAGPPAREILSALPELSVDAVALTTHGRTGLARAAYGSVTEKILAEGGVPVLALRNRALRPPLPFPLEEHRFLGVR